MSKIYIINILFVLLLTACGGGKQAVTRFYLLDYPEAQDPDRSLTGLAGTVPFSCIVADVDIHPAFASHQIAIREYTNQINYFSFNEWAVRPSQSLTQLIVRFIKNNELCHMVSGSQSIIESDYLIETYVSRMDVTTEKKAFIANLAVEFKLVDNKTKQAVAVHNSESKKLLQDKTLNQFASAISEMFVDELYAFAGQLSLQLPAE